MIYVKINYHCRAEEDEYNAYHAFYDATTEDEIERAAASEYVDYVQYLRETYPDLTEETSYSYSGYDWNYVSEQEYKANTVNCELNVAEEEETNNTCAR